MKPENRPLLLVLLLFVPAIAMTITNEVDWSFLDFSIMGVMLFTLGWAIRWARLNTRHRTTQWLIVSAVFGLFLLIWMGLAVGLFSRC
jgi:hypothetical protein